MHAGKLNSQTLPSDPDTAARGYLLNVCFKASYFFTSLCKLLIYFVPAVPLDLRIDIMRFFLKVHREVAEKLA